MISVIMLTYNREQLVSRAIEGTLGQTYRDFEFIIVDNGSTDESGQIADRYAAQDNRIRIWSLSPSSFSATPPGLGALATFLEYLSTLAKNRLASCSLWFSYVL